MTNEMPTILIASSLREAREATATQLDADGYRVLQATAPANAVQLLEEDPVLLLLGTLGSAAGAPELLRELRAGLLECPEALPVITFGPADTVSHLRAYEAGSDHHLPADVSYVLLREIIAAVVRRCRMGRPAHQVIRVGPMSIDQGRREVRLDGDLIEMPGREFELLRTLATDPTRVFTKEQLLLGIWGHGDTCRSRTLDSHACRLRKRLTVAGGHGLVRNVWGVGYRLIDS